jgi:hypothetical protein
VGRPFEFCGLFYQFKGSFRIAIAVVFTGGIKPGEIVEYLGVLGL